MNSKWIFGAAAGALGISSLLAGGLPVSAGQTNRMLRYTSRSPAEARAWQANTRKELFQALKLTDLAALRKKLPLNPRVIAAQSKGDYLWREVEFNSTPGRRIRVVTTRPTDSKPAVPAVVCIHGHGGNRHVVYDRHSIYRGFADALARRGYATIAADVGQHQVAEPGRLLMGERLWDLIRCIDYLETLPGIDRDRIGCAGLSLGGEMAMWLGAMDERVSATVSAGFLTRMDQLETNHCRCWKFPGLRQRVDFADIYSLMAPRPLLCQNGWQEPPSQFPVPIARQALAEVRVIYADFGHPEWVSLDAHQGGHVIDLPSLLQFFETHLRPPP